MSISDCLQTVNRYPVISIVGRVSLHFNDSDVARTDIAETFHQGITVDNGATIDSATITNLANTQLMVLNDLWCRYWKPEDW